MIVKLLHLLEFRELFVKSNEILYQESDFFWLGAKNSDRRPQLGIVNFAQKRSVKTSYTVWQWFSQQAIAHDVLAITQLKAETLVAAQSDVKQLCQLVQTEQWVKVDEP